MPADCLRSIHLSNEVTQVVRARSRQLRNKAWAGSMETHKSAHEIRVVVLVSPFVQKRNDDNLSIEVTGVGNQSKVLSVDVC